MKDKMDEDGTMSEKDFNNCVKKIATKEETKTFVTMFEEDGRVQVVALARALCGGLPELAQMKRIFQRTGHYMLVNGADLRRDAKFQNDTMNCTTFCKEMKKRNVPVTPLDLAFVLGNVEGVGVSKESAKKNKKDA